MTWERNNDDDDSVRTGGNGVKSGLDVERPKTRTEVVMMTKCERQNERGGCLIREVDG